MANVVINDKHLTDIANAIRFKTSDTRVENGLVDVVYPEVIVAKTENALSFDVCEPDTSYQTQYPAQTEPYAIKVDCSTLIEMGATRIQYELKGLGCYGPLVKVVPLDQYDRFESWQYGLNDKAAIVVGLYDSYSEAEAALAPGYDDIDTIGHLAIQYDKSNNTALLPEFGNIYPPVNMTPGEMQEKYSKIEFSGNFKNAEGFTLFLWRTSDRDIQPCYFYGEVVGIDADGNTIGTTIQIEQPVEVPNTFTPREMAEQIKAIPQIKTTPLEEHWINFYDLDGTIVETWTYDELKAATELPPVIEREGLISDGWNWSLEGLKACGTPMNVAMHYQTTHGGLEVVLKVKRKGGSRVRSFVYPKYSKSGFSIYTAPFTVDWGDGTIERPDHTYPMNLNPYYHTYGKAGEYRIKIYADEGDYPNLWYNFDIRSDAEANGRQSCFLGVDGYGVAYKEIYHPNSFCFDGTDNINGAYPAWVIGEDNPCLEIVSWPRDNAYPGFVTGRETGVENHPFGGYYGNLKFLVVPYYISQIGALEGQGNYLTAISFSETPADKTAVFYSGSIQNLIALKSIYYAPRRYNNTYFPGISNEYTNLALCKVAYPKGHNLNSQDELYNIYLPSAYLFRLEDIYLPYNKPPKVPDTANLITLGDESVIFHIPKGKMDVYRSCDGWSSLPEAAYVEDLEIEED